MSGKLSTHVLDLTTGKPAAGMRIHLFRHGQAPQHLKTVTTNADGRVDKPLLDVTNMAVGPYQLIFCVRDYYTAVGKTCEFLDCVPVHFTITDADAAYHVPLLVTPWAYSTYRGS